MDYGLAWGTIDGASEITLVVFEGDDAPALVGTYTVTGLALGPEPSLRVRRPPGPVLFPAVSATVQPRPETPAAATGLG